MKVDYLGSTYLPLTLMPSTEFSITEGLSGLEATLFLGDFARHLRGGRRWKGQVDTGGRGLEVITLREFKR